MMSLLQISFLVVTISVAAYAEAQESSDSSDGVKPEMMKNVYVTQQPEPVTPYMFRFSLEAGDQAGGPVRYNTRFPTSPDDPNPTSYYHTQAFAAANFEFAFERGALQLGALTRRDFAHRGIEGRSELGPDGNYWTVKKLDFRSDAFTLGWVFGRMYREAPWVVSLASIVDYSQMTIQVANTNDASQVRQSQTKMIAATLRGRLLMRLLGSGLLDLHVGPEFHVPLYSKVKTTTDSDDAAWVGDLMRLQSTSAIGLVAQMGVRF